MSGSMKDLLLQATVTLTGSFVLATKDMPMGHADQVIIFVEYVNAGADSLEYKIETTSLDSNAPAVATDYYQETMENEDKANGLGKTILKVRDFVPQDGAITYRFSNVIPVSENFFRISFKETIGGGAFGTVKITAVANYVGRP